MKTLTLKEKVMECLEEMAGVTLKDLWNHYCDENSYGETIWHIGEFDEISGCNNRPFKETYNNMDENFNFSHDYFVETDNGNYVSFDNVEDFLENCYLSDLANWIINEGENRHFPSDVNEILEVEDND